MNVRGFRSTIGQAEPGKTIYINTINLTPGCIKQLREYIKEGILIPDISEVEKMIVPDSIEKVMTGDMICPQMNYTKILPR